MQGGKNRILPKEMNENWFFWGSHWLEIWSNHFCPSLGPNGGSVAMGSGCRACHKERQSRGKMCFRSKDDMPNTQLFLPLHAYFSRIYKNAAKSLI